LILVDSSVWIDYFNGVSSPETQCLHSLLGKEILVIGDLILIEVLQGFRLDRDFHTARELLSGLEVFDLCNRGLAIKCADNFRFLRKKGITVRKTIDVIIATFCIEHGLPLLYADRDFEPFRKYLGLESGLK